MRLSSMGKGILLVAAAVVLQAKEPVKVEPESIQIVSPQGVVEYQGLLLKASDGKPFVVKSARVSAGRVNVDGGPFGVRAISQGFNVYLAATLKPGTYADEIVFEFADKSRQPLKVPVRIKVTEPLAQQD